ncbi:hypothetical protein [Enterobacter hormaechei]|uniref:hypothetical protein n=1 Tax=Enterobacter hormaechei TaxID=158836 RepID=UPI0007972FA3|nr:hypothetical protein [Enterobacter hormaechei]MBT1781931.1 hypothetical protein [Enterobacter hormaechei subsp. xiangfangensis]MBW7710695.1 hypothetical protein [Enterobacter hormaechei]MBW7777571.1 hypothetical protein [Enterobacter hormaechei]SAC69142.1 Uncharacterised protein [Enterobacter hormaechei]
MSTITREFTKEQLQQIIETDHVQCGEASSLARIALASLEAEPVCVIDQSNLDYLKSGSDADVWPASRTEMGDVLLYRSAPPAPVSVPDAIHSQGEKSASDDYYALGWNACRAAMLQGAEPVTTAYKLRDAVEIIRNSGIEIDSGKIQAERDSLNSPVIPDCSCRTCRPVTFSDSRFVVCPECGNKRCPHANDHRNACTGSNEPGQEGSAYPAAPQQEVK